MPIPLAKSIILSQRQRTLLKQIVRCTTNPYRLVRRARLVLAAADGVSNTHISQQLQLDRGQVRWWRQRWIDGSEQLAQAEAEQVSDKKLMALIEQFLSDRPRRGTPQF